MTTTKLFNDRSALRRPAALLGMIALCLSTLTLTPFAQASNGAGNSAAVGADRTDESRETQQDLDSGQVRTTPDQAKKGKEVKHAARPSESSKKKGTEISGAAQDGDDIVGGTTAGSYPSYVALKGIGQTSSFCGATLVSSVWVLTAAHCVDGGVTPGQLKLVIGAPTWANEAAGDTRSVTSITIHPSWNPATFDNDVAMLRLDTASTKPWARLAEPADPVNPGNTVRAVGHGATSEGGSQSSTLLQVDLPIQSDATMSAAAQYGASFHGAVMIGAGPLAGGMDTCQGDSGGPLYTNFNAIQPALVGDTSWGTGCARPNKPGIYGEVYQGAMRTFVNGIVGRPANDNFAGSGIAGADGTVFGSNTDATGQPGEPAIAGSPADTSVWYSWTAPESGPTSFNLRDAAFDTTLNVFTGNSFGTLASVASNDDTNGTLQSKVTFNATAGTTYRIAVDGFSAAHGFFGLQWAQNSPANDNFGSPTVLSGATGKSYANTARSTGEPGEPSHVGIPDRSVWYSWTAPETGSAVLNTRESNFDTVIAMYTGTSITGLTQLATNDDFNGTVQSKITVPVTAGTTYRIAVDGFSAAVGSLGLQWSINPPANDNFASPQVLPGQAGTTAATTVRATGEPGELDYHGGAIADNSVWFNWTSSNSGSAVVRLLNVAGGLSPGIGVYTGNSLGALTSVGSGATQATFNAVAGTTYRIAVDGNGGSTGTFNLEWDGPTAPDAPAVTSTTPSPGRISVAFSPPASDGGSPITDYFAQCVSTDGGVTGSRIGTSSPLVVNGLSGGKNYRCRVEAKNAIGWGPYSPYGATVLVPAPTVPGAPSVTSTTPSGNTISVAFSAPASDGGSPITTYFAQCVSTDGGVTGSRTGTSSPLVVNGLSGAKNYRCRVEARNAVGWGPYSPYGATVTLPTTPPGAPSVTSSTPAAGRVTVAFTPGPNGGSPITNFFAQCVSTDGGVTGSRTGAASPLVVTGLTPGKNYRCRVEAQNAVGWGPYSPYGATVLVP